MLPFLAMNSFLSTSLVMALIVARSNHQRLSLICPAAAGLAAAGTAAGWVAAGAAVAAAAGLSAGFGAVVAVGAAVWPQAATMAPLTPRPNSRTTVRRVI